jgi:parallel beta-helix repeat protein
MSKRFGGQRVSGSRRHRQCLPTLEPVERRLLMATFVVDNTGDSGSGSLRQAIMDSNSAPPPSGQSNLIDFEIGVGTQVIEPISELPAITATVAIDTTVSMFGSQQIIEIEGDQAGSSANGLTLQSAGNVVSGLEVTLFGGSGICVDSSSNTIGGPASGAGNVISGNQNNGIEIIGGTGNLVLGNMIGTDVAGMVANGNANDGIFIQNSGNNTIGGATDDTTGVGNVISGNDNYGIEIVSGDGNDVLGNMIGTDVTGENAIGNSSGGLIVNSSNNTIGGTNDFNISEPNLISGNQGDGIEINVGTKNVVLGNMIGTDLMGELSLPNGNDGLLIQGSGNNTIGGTDSDAMNLISGNGDYGIHVDGGDGNTFLGNFVGTDVNETIAIPNGSGGLFFEKSGHNTIGGTVEGAGNLISGNEGNGIEISGGAGDNVLQGNLIGSFISIVATIGNQGDGLLIESAGHNTIGGTVMAAMNVISGNQNNGIEIMNAGGNCIQGNDVGTDSSGLDPIGNGEDGLLLESSPNNTIGGPIDTGGNVISDNGADGSGNGIEINVGNGNLILGNMIGTDSSGGDGSQTSLGNGEDGLLIEDSGSNTIGGTASGLGNLISGNQFSGIEVDTGGGNVFLGNMIGTDGSGYDPMGNGQDGIMLSDSSNNTIGGTVSGSSNLISANVGNGIEINTGNDSGVAVNNDVLGNMIGTDVTGATALGNTMDGVLLESSPSNTIGGTASGAGNLISGNLGNGIEITSADDNAILGNRIGTDAMGMDPVGNTMDGVLITNSSGSTIGGTAAGASNLISGNGTNGIEISGGDNTDVLGNMIGTDVTGASTTSFGLGNYKDGVLVDQSSTNNTIGGTVAAASNLISGNQANGIEIDGGDANSNGFNVVLGNLIGTDVVGMNSIANAKDGVFINSSRNNTIGGAAPGASNLISGNGTNGIEISFGDANEILGNMIGTDVMGDVTGSSILGNGQDGLLMTHSSNDTIGGTASGAMNVISDNSANGIDIFSGDDDVILGNHIGIDVTGMTSDGNTEAGLSIDTGSGNTIGGTASGAGNLISDNGTDGILINDGDHTAILGNLIGTDVTSSGDDGNSQDGVLFENSSNNTIGGTAAGAGNVISNNSANGIEIDGVSQELVGPGSVDVGGQNEILGNMIGTDSTGQLDTGNDQNGVFISGSPNNTIGAANIVNSDGSIGSFFSNVISNNSSNGIFISAAASNLVIGDLIGTDSTGTFNAENFGDGVNVSFSTNNTIGGDTLSTRNVISNNGKDGVLLNIETDDVVEGNVIGSDVTGTVAAGNVNSGISLTDGSGNTIGGIVAGSGNLILGNNGVGVSLTGSSSNSIQGNRIGLNLQEAILANIQDGISLNSGSNGNTIGGLVGGARNIISGNLNAGITIVNLSNGNLIEGNYVGLDSTGLSGRGNKLNGIYIATSGNTVGGSVLGAANVVSGNRSGGVVISGAAATGNLVAGNLIGTNALGGVNPKGGPPDVGLDGLPIGNLEDGVFINDNAVLNTIGGTSPLARNVISGNGGNGVQILSVNFMIDPNQPVPTGNLVVGNFIGTDASGLNPDNNAANGVFIYNARGNTVGQAGAGGGNLIEGNLGSGIAIQGEAGTNNVVEANLIGSAKSSLGNQGGGVTLVEADDNQIGGFGPGEGNTILGNGGSGISDSGSLSAMVVDNVISGNLGDGVLVASDSTNTLVSGNKIGVDASGESADANGLDGVRFSDAGTGGLVVSNVISANKGSGVEITGRSSSTTVQGNKIGVDASGEVAMGNNVGVEVDGVPGVTIGGFASGSGNLISGNSVGIQVTPLADTSAALNDQIAGNVIGLDASGAKALGNIFGIFLNDAVGVTIGGLASGSRNVISGNTNVGVQIFRVTAGGSGDLVEGNIIGLDPSGLFVPTGAIQPVGVFVNSASNNTIGGMVAGARNVISGNTTGNPNTPSYGISIFGQSNGIPVYNVVEGNDIGLDVNGNRLPTVAGSPIQTVGVAINTSSGNLIGGTSGPARNTIGGNVVGVQVVGIVEKFANLPTGNVIVGDTIDFNTYGVFLSGASGNAVVNDNLSLNTSIGLSIVGSLASGNTVTGNTISGNGSLASGPQPGGGNGDGVYIDGAKSNIIEHNTIQNNGLGGKSPTGVGVYIFDNASGNIVASNVIKGNTAYGILVFNSAANLSSIPMTGKAVNKISGSGIASFREFTGTLTTTTKTTKAKTKTTAKHATPKGPKVTAKASTSHSSHVLHAKARSVSHR